MILILRKSFIKFMSTVIITLLIVLGIYMHGIDSKPSMASFITSLYFDKSIEIYDIDKGAVIKAVPLNNVMLHESRNILFSITGVYTKVKAFPEKGYIIKIPIEPALVTCHKLLNSDNINSVGKFFIMVPGDGAPYLLILDSSSKPHLYNFDFDPSSLFQQLGVASFAYAKYLMPIASRTSSTVCFATF